MELGYEVYAVSSAVQALKLAHDQLCFDLVMSDCYHAGDVRAGDGQEAFRALRERFSRDDVGSYGLPRCFGKTAFISKPFTLADLRSVMDEAVSPSC